MTICHSDIITQRHSTLSFEGVFHGELKVNDIKKPYPLLAFEKAVEEGRVVIDKRDGKEHRRFSITLRPSQILRSLKSCLNKKEFDQSCKDELMLVTKKMIDLLINIDPESSDILYRHFKGRLEGFYKERTRVRRELSRGF